MPIYEFECKKCGKIFEYLCLKSEDNQTPCPSCGGKKTEKLLSTFSSFSSSSNNQGFCDAPTPECDSSCGSSGGFS